MTDLPIGGDALHADPKAVLRQTTDVLVAAASQAARILAPDPGALRYLENLQVRGVLPSQHRVLLYDRQAQRSMALTVGKEIARPPVFLRLQDLSEHNVVFTDDVGLTYIKYY